MPQRRPRRRVEVNVPIISFGGYPARGADRYDALRVIPDVGVRRSEVATTQFVCRRLAGPE